MEAVGHVSNTFVTVFFFFFIVFRICTSDCLFYQFFPLYFLFVIVAHLCLPICYLSNLFDGMLSCSLLFMDVRARACLNTVWWLAPEHTEPVLCVAMLPKSTHFLWTRSHLNMNNIYGECKCILNGEFRIPTSQSGDIL